MLVTVVVLVLVRTPTPVLVVVVVLVRTPTPVLVVVLVRVRVLVRPTPTPTPVLVPVLLLVPQSQVKSPQKSDGFLVQTRENCLLLFDVRTIGLDLKVPDLCPRSEFKLIFCPPVLLYYQDLHLGLRMNRKWTLNL